MLPPLLIWLTLIANLTISARLTPEKNRLAPNCAARPYALPLPDVCRQYHELPDQFSALCQASSAQRMLLGEQASRRIGDKFTALGVITIPDELSCTTFRTQSERLIGEQLIGGEAVMSTMKRRNELKLKSSINSANFSIVR